MYGVRKLRSMCAVPSRAVRWITLNDRFLDILSKYVPLDPVTLPSAPTTIGMVCTRLSPQLFFNSISRSLYLVIFSASFLQDSVRFANFASCFRTAVFSVVPSRRSRDQAHEATTSRRASWLETTSRRGLTTNHRPPSGGRRLLVGRNQ